MLNPKICSKARLARDPRFDGMFFTAVKTTRIYCRSICPATPPREKNVRYFPTAIEAANAGFRPCLRCRPDSAPGSSAWNGVNTTLDRAIKLINEGALQYGSLPLLAARLGITDRYLRQLFKRYIGVSPKAYALYQQCLFAKKLLHQTRLPITQIALASGFGSVRRFNDCFKTQLQLTPSAVRKQHDTLPNTLQPKVYYRPPYDWQTTQHFLATRVIENLDWCDTNSYGRTFEWLGACGQFTAEHNEKEHCFDITLEIDDVSQLKPVINNIRRVLDTDADTQTIETDLKPFLSVIAPNKKGLRLPGTWSLFEAGIKAILGQQISVSAAKNLVTLLVNELGSEFGDKRIFPSPQQIAEDSLDFLKIPLSRKGTLRSLAKHHIDSHTPEDTLRWLEIKGIGPWTVDYARLRGLSDPDVYLGGDLGVKRAMNKLDPILAPELAAPWRSYLTIYLWSNL